MKQIDSSKDMQTFTAVGEVELDELEIQKGEMIGKGAQAEVFIVTLDNLEVQLFVDKTKKIKNNKIHADRQLRNMFSEFNIARDLVHPNIIKYKYFMRNFDPLAKQWDFHIIIEFMEGKDMNVYIKENKPDI